MSNIVGRLILVLAISTALTLAASQLVDPIYVFGGSECSDTACWGYAPVGLVAIVVVSAGIAAPLERTARRTKRLWIDD